MAFCHACKGDVQPVTQIGHGGKTARCPKCGGGLAREEPTHDGKSAARRPRDQTQPAADADVDILALAKDRLAFVEARVAELTKYHDEARRLRMMISAAEPTTPAEPEEQ